MDKLVILLAVALIIAFFVVGPWLSILAVNQLFGTSIQLTFWNWLATFWIHLVVAGSRSSKN